MLVDIKDKEGNVFDKPNADKLACMLRRENVTAR